MSIKGVGNGPSPYDQIQIRNEQDAADGSAQGVNNSSAKGDAITVSEDARLMNVAREAIKNTPETREEKVARLKAEVSAGTYNPDAKLTADKLVSEELDLWD